MPIRVQRKRTKGWKMLLDLPSNVGILHLWHGVKEYHLIKLFAYRVKWLLVLSQIIFVQAKSILNSMKSAVNGITNIGEKKERLTHFLLLIRRKKEKYMNVIKLAFYEEKYLRNLVENVVSVVIKIIEFSRLIIEKETGAKIEKEKGGLIEKIFSNYQTRSLINYTKFFAQIAMLLKHGVLCG